MVIEQDGTNVVQYKKAKQTFVEDIGMNYFKDTDSNPRTETAET